LYMTWKELTRQGFDGGSRKTPQRAQILTGRSDCNEERVGTSGNRPCWALAARTGLVRG
jgi:hypothetical protein